MYYKCYLQVYQMQNVLKKRNYQNEAYQVNVFFLISKAGAVFLT